MRQLDRLLAACGLQARIVLEPLTSDLDQVLDDARTGTASRSRRAGTSRQRTCGRTRGDRCTSLLGFLQVRFVEQLPSSVLSVEVDGRLVPVLPLAQVRRTHARLAELLDRHEHRLGAGPGSRTV